MGRGPIFATLALFSIWSGRCQLNFLHFLWVKMVSHLLLKTHLLACKKTGIFRDLRFLGPGRYGWSRGS